MARSRRHIQPGRWFHVMNRGIARRTVFENETDIRYFLACLARSVRAKRIEVHSYCILTTHFHILVRSIDGRLSTAIGETLNAYVRWFNRARGRDGPLFRGRFHSRWVDSVEYRSQLVRYIDQNAMEAGLVPDAALYPHGSRWWYARNKGPIWLSRTWVESEVKRRAGAPHFTPSDYRKRFGGSADEHVRDLVERRSRHTSAMSDPLDDLLRAAPDRVLDWMRRKADLADGTEIDLPICNPLLVRQVVQREKHRDPGWRVVTTRKSLSAWPILECGLLRRLSACSWIEIGQRLSIDRRWASTLMKRHDQLLNSDAHYARCSAECARKVLDRHHGMPRIDDIRCQAPVGYDSPECAS